MHVRHRCIMEMGSAHKYNIDANTNMLKTIIIYLFFSGLSDSNHINIEIKYLIYYSVIIICVYG